MEVKLLVVDGETEARQFEVVLPVVIGRSRSTDLKLGDPLISRRHCEVFEDDGSLMLRDLGSLNGTFVDGRRLAEEPAPIEPGAKFTVGPVTFQAEYRAAQPAPPPPSVGPDQTLDAPLELDSDDETPPAADPPN